MMLVLNAKKTTEIKKQKKRKKRRKRPICNLFGEHMVDWPRQKSYVALLFLYYNGHSFKSMNCEMRAGNHCSARVRLKSNYRIDWWFQQGCRSAAALPSCENNRFLIFKFCYIPETILRSYIYIVYSDIHSC